MSSSGFKMQERGAMYEFGTIAVNKFLLKVFVVE